MRIGLFIPCYIDQFFPQVGLATVEVLQRFPQLELDYPRAQTCCGQPMANTGCLDDTRPLAERFVEIFADYDHVVSPSGSCVSMVRNHYEAFFHSDPRFERMKTRVWELCEFLVDVLHVDSWPNSFPHRVGLHASCHGLRELRLGACSERMGQQPDKVRSLLQMVPQLELVELQRGDECCGFGGTFAVAEEGVSVMMGTDRVNDHIQAGAEVMTATDTSCLMHMDGLIRRRRQPLVTMHIAEILAGRAIAK
jgi:L-lactate dehydrogenase complex protein LldE